MSRREKPRAAALRPARRSGPDIPPPTLPPAPGNALALAWGVFACVVLFSYWYVIRLDFSNDDFLILDEVALRPFHLGLAWSALIAGWWRPWSRELHYWAISGAFGFNPSAFHLASLLLWLAVLACLLVLVRQLTDARIAVLAVTGALAASAWGIYLTWASCSQDLWMLLFGELFLLAQLGNRRALAPIALAFALLSKETALLMLPIGMWMQFSLRGRSGLKIREWIAPLLVVIVWAAVHPSMGGRWFFGQHTGFFPSPANRPSVTSLRYLLAPLNLEWWPEPREGWTKAALQGALWATALGALAWSVLRDVPARAAVPKRTQWIRLGLGWWAISWAPWMLSALSWHSYYGWFGICGAWVAAAAWLMPRPRVLVAIIVAVAALRPAATQTYARDWGTEIVQRLAGERTQRIREQLLGFYPALPRHARVFIAGVPAGSGLLTSPRYSCAMHVWYRDTTVVLAGLTQYWARTAADSLGPDHFCVLERDFKLLPLAIGSASVPDSLRSDPVWSATEENVGAMLALGGNWHRARDIFSRLATTYPDTARDAYDLGVALDSLGDPAGARAWYQRADSIIGAPATGASSRRHF